MFVGHVDPSSTITRDADLANYLHLMGYPNLAKLITNGQRVKAATAWDKGDETLRHRGVVAAFRWFS